MIFGILVVPKVVKTTAQNCTIISSSTENDDDGKDGVSSRVHPTRASKAHSHPPSTVNVRKFD